MIKTKNNLLEAIAVSLRF